MAFFATTVPLSAHPHIWIDSSLTFTVSGHRLTSVEVEWVFDEFFTEMIMLDFDSNRDRRIDSSESRQIRESAFDNLRHYGYFMEVRVNNQRRDVVPQMVRNFQAFLRDDSLVYRFEVALDVPVSRDLTRVTVAMYDETYFTEIYMQDNPPARVRGEPPDVQAQLSMETRMDRVWYFVNIPTREVVLQIRRSS